MQKLLVITDLHICTPGETIIGLDPTLRFRQVLDAALTTHPDAAALILMGDLTHRGLPAEYAALAAVLADVAIPVIPMLGNHDRRDAFLAAFPDAPRTAHGHIQSLLDLGDHRIITLDSLDGPPYRAGHHSGRLCPERLGFLTDALAGAQDKGALVFVHHPPFDTGIAGMDAIKLADGADLLALLRDHPRVHLVCGHIHRTISGSTVGVPWTIFKSPCHQGVIDLTDTNSSLSVDEPGAYGLILLTDDGIVAHSEDVFAEPPATFADCAPIGRDRPVSENLP